MNLQKSFRNLGVLSATGLLALLAGGCGSFNQTADSQLKGANGQFDPRIGEAYNDQSDRHLSHSCLSIDENDVEFIPPQLGDLTITQNANFDQLSDALTAGGQLSLNLSAFQAKGELQFANEMKSDSYSTTFMVSFNVKGGEYALKQQGATVKLNDNGLAAKQTADEKARVEKCGTRFVSRKALAANVVAVLKFEFANKGQRDAFNGKLELNVSDIVKGQAQVEKAISSAGESANITLKATQLGGDAAALGQIIDLKLAQCSATNRAACQDGMATILKYVRENFPAQFKNENGKALPERYATVGYDYATYNSIDAAWTPPKLSPEMAGSLNLQRRHFGELMVDEQGNYNRASALLRSGMKISASELVDIRELQTVITSRIDAMATAAQHCYTDNWVSCKEKLEAARVDLKKPQFAYDETKLVILPSDMGGWCAKLNQYGAVLKDIPAGAGDAVSGTILTDEELYTLSKMFGALKPDGSTLDLNPLGTTPKTMVVGKIDCAKVKFAVRDTNADKVSLASQRLNNIDPLTSLAYTTAIDLSSNFIEDALPLSKMRFLESLNLSKNRVTSLAGIRGTYLTTLNLADNRLRNAAKDGADGLFIDISGTSTLVTLDLSTNPALISLAQLRDLASLETLNLLDTGVTPAELTEFLKRAPKEFPALRQVQVTTSKIPNCVALSSQYQVIDCI